MGARVRIAKMRTLMRKFRIMLLIVAGFRSLGLAALCAQPPGSLDESFSPSVGRPGYDLGGSPSSAVNFNGPTNKICGYGLAFPKDDPFLGATEAVIDFPQWDNTAQREQIAQWIAGQLELPFNYRRFVQLFVNGMPPDQRPTINFGTSWARIFED